MLASGKDDGMAPKEPGDRFPSARKALHALQQHDDFPKGPVERIEINLVASGEATYRIWEPRADEPVGGLLTRDQLA